MARRGPWWAISRDKSAGTTSSSTWTALPGRDFRQVLKEARDVRRAPRAHRPWVARRDGRCGPPTARRRGRLRPAGNLGGAQAENPGHADPARGRRDANRRSIARRDQGPGVPQCVHAESRALGVGRGRTDQAARPHRIRSVTRFGARASQPAWPHRGCRGGHTGNQSCGLYAEWLRGGRRRRRHAFHAGGSDTDLTGRRRGTRSHAALDDPRVARRSGGANLRGRAHLPRPRRNVRSGRRRVDARVVADGAHLHV